MSLRPKKGLVDFRGLHPYLTISVQFLQRNFNSDVVVSISISGSRNWYLMFGFVDKSACFEDKAAYSNIFDICQSDHSLL